MGPTNKCIRNQRSNWMFTKWVYFPLIIFDLFAENFQDHFMDYKEQHKKEHELLTSTFFDSDYNIFNKPKWQIKFLFHKVIFFHLLLKAIVCAMKWRYTLWTVNYTTAKDVIQPTGLRISQWGIFQYLDWPNSCPSLMKKKTQDMTCTKKTHRSWKVSWNYGANLWDICGTIEDKTVRILYCRNELDNLPIKNHKNSASSLPPVQSLIDTTTKLHLHTSLAYSKEASV